ncbi:MAG: hypothetical protein IJ264_06220, partial [Clostridia bacterium]|nr:hypothetical protein [Clostridia bacterium]
MTLAFLFLFFSLTSNDGDKKSYPFAAEAVTSPEDDRLTATTQQSPTTQSVSQSASNAMTTVRYTTTTSYYQTTTGIPTTVAPEISYENAIEISSGATLQVNITGGYETFLKFVPETDGVYSLLSQSGRDTYCTLYDSSLDNLFSDDDGGENNEFRLTYTLEAGN